LNRLNKPILSKATVETRFDAKKEFRASI